MERKKSIPFQKNNYWIKWTRWTFCGGKGSILPYEHSFSCRAIWSHQFMGYGLSSISTTELIDLLISGHKMNVYHTTIVYVYISVAVLKLLIVNNCQQFATTDNLFDKNVTRLLHQEGETWMFMLEIVTYFLNNSLRMQILGVCC